MTLRVSSTHTVSTTTYNSNGNGMSGTPVNLRFSTTHNMSQTVLIYAATFSSQRALRRPFSMRNRTTGESPPIKMMFSLLDSWYSLLAACLQRMSPTSSAQTHLQATRTTRANGHMTALTSQVNLSALLAPDLLPFRASPSLRLKRSISPCFNALPRIQFQHEMIPSIRNT